MPSTDGPVIAPPPDGDDRERRPPEHEQRPDYREVWYQIWHIDPTH